MTAIPLENVPQWSLGDRLEKARRSAGFARAKDFAAALTEAGYSISKSTVSNWENDVQDRIDPELVNLWAALTHTSRAWLLGVDDNNRAESDMSRPDLTLIIGDAKHTGGPSPLIGVVH